MNRKLASVDTAPDGNPIYKGGHFYGILNKQGDFWTPIIFNHPNAAKKFFEDFWTNRASVLWRHYKVVPVRVRLDELSGGDHD